MSELSIHCLLRMVRSRGLEPPHSYGYMHLKHARLPIPPQPQNLKLHTNSLEQPSRQFEPPGASVLIALEAAAETRRNERSAGPAPLFRRAASTSSARALVLDDSVSSGWSGESAPTPLQSRTTSFPFA
jgi:hypothetical protein